jgi:hypothetical protein
MILQFKNWDKYNKRQKDIKRPYWFAHSNEIFLDPFYVELDLFERQAFLWLLCEASRQNKYGLVEVSFKLFEQVTGFKKKCLETTIDKLLKSQAAAGSRQDGGRNATATVQDSTRQDRTEICVSDETPQPSIKVSNSALEAIYSEYPKRLGNQGKADAFKSLISILKKDTTLGIYQDVLSSVRAYKSFCSRNGLVGTEKVAMFSTFFGRKQLWKDWVGSEVSHQPSSLSDEEFQRLAFGAISEQS